MMNYKIKIKNQQELNETISYLRKNKIGIASRDLETNEIFPITLRVSTLDTSKLGIGKSYYLYIRKILIIDTKVKREKNIKEIHDILRAEKLLKEI